LVILVIAWIAAVGTLVTDVLGYTHNLAMFGRSGAVLTLSAIVLEYKLSTKGQNDSTYKEGGPISLGAVGKAVLLTDSEKRMKQFAHISVILGTLIWGFGDLVGKFINL
jgi:hypothetical protein